MALGTLSPDEQTVIFARNHNLYMMDAANYAKAQKNANDASIVETKLTTDGEEYYSFARTVRAALPTRPVEVSFTMPLVPIVDASTS